MRYRHAESLWREAVAMRTRLHGPDHALVGVGLAAPGVILTRRGSHDEAEQVRAIRLLETARPEGHPDRRNAHRNLAALYRLLGRHADADRQKALARQ